MDYEKAFDLVEMGFVEVVRRCRNLFLYSKRHHVSPYPRPDYETDPTVARNATRRYDLPEAVHRVLNRDFY